MSNIFCIRHNSFKNSFSYRKYCRCIFVLLFIINCIFNFKLAKADFFSTCGITKKDIKSIEYVLKNGSSRIIPAEIENISDKNFRDALYVILFLRDLNQKIEIPDGFFKIINIDDIKHIKNIKRHILKYYLKQDYDDFELQKLFKELHFSNSEKIQILLKHRNFYKKIGITYFQSLIRDLFNENLINIEEIHQLINNYSNFIDDEMLLNQIKIRLWLKNNRDIDDIKKFIIEEENKKKLNKILTFYNLINIKIKKEVNFKNKNNRKKKNRIIYELPSKKYIKQQCDKYKNKDEFIDLVCISKNIDDKDYIEDILLYNDNPTFIPDKWLKYRLMYSREQLSSNNDEKLQKAYKVISQAGKLIKDDYYTQQFLSGFIAFIRKDYENAIIHFENCANNSFYSEYNSKANYWLGLSYRHFGDTMKTFASFKKACNNPLFLYGQLACDEINLQPEMEIKNYFNNFYKNDFILCNDIRFIIGYLEQYFLKKDNNISNYLLGFIGKNTSKAKIYNSIFITHQDFKEDLIKDMVIYGLKYGVAYQKYTFPISNYNSDSFINAIIKKESNFKKGVIGGAGERGLMQIMPATGKFLTNKMGINYNNKRLLFDEEYNIRIGNFYIQSLLDKFDNNKILALASYNAGSNNVLKWIDENGDIRKMQTNEDISIWIEKIPFYFTRSYVANIIGTEMVYDVLKQIG